MAGTAQTRDGRKSLAYILSVDKTTEKTDALAIGDIVLIVAKASSSSIFGDVPVNHFFVANKALTPVSGDKYYDVTPKFCGFATGKTVSESKNVTESTIDYDKAAVQQTDGIVTKSGSLSGAMITESLDSTSAINPIKQRFDSMMEIDATGDITYVEPQTSVKDVLMIAWNGRDAATGDLLELEIIPALFTNLSKGGQYNSDQTFDVDFSGNYVDDNGFIGDVMQVRATAGLVAALLKTQRSDFSA